MSLRIADEAAARATRNSEALASFAAYCFNNPDQRFWQALRNWSRYDQIMGVVRIPAHYDAQGQDHPTTVRMENTFDLEGLEGSMAEHGERDGTDREHHRDRDGGDQRGACHGGVGDRNAGSGGADDRAGDAVHRRVVPDWAVAAPPAWAVGPVAHVTVALDPELLAWLQRTFGEQPVTTALLYTRQIVTWFEENELNEQLPKVPSRRQRDIA